MSALRKVAKYPGRCVACGETIEPGDIITRNAELERWVHVQCRPGAPRWRAIAERRWPTAEWIEGNAQWALLAPCGALTVVLYPSEAVARRWMAGIDRNGCGHHCSLAGSHRIVDLGA